MVSKPVFYSIIAVLIGFTIMSTIYWTEYGSREQITNGSINQFDELTSESKELKSYSDQTMQRSSSEWRIVFESLALNLIIAFGIYLIAKRRLQ